MVFFCYIDESGVPQIPGNTSHYILSGLSIPISKWKYCDRRIGELKRAYSLPAGEIHTAWMVRSYLEQSKIQGFETKSRAERIYEVERIRKMELLRLQKSGNKKLYKQTKKNYQKTLPYIHLSFKERLALIEELADLIGSWSFARLFAECIDKIHFDPARAKYSVDEQALEQVVSRFEQYLQILSKSKKDRSIYGALIHDNNETVSLKHTELMKTFHQKGTLWTRIDRIIETPLFVNSELTSLVQIADLCAFALRRYFENGEEILLGKIMPRIDKKNGRIVGVRHFADDSCQCLICS